MAAHVFVKRTHDVGFNERGEDDRAKAFFFFHLVNTLSGFQRLINRIDKRNTRLMVVKVRELRHDRMSKRFSRNGRPVTHDEYLTTYVAFLRVSHGGVYLKDENSVDSTRRMRRLF